MKKRAVDASRLRRMKKLRLTERLSESAYTLMRLVLLWCLVLLVDFLLDFRLEYLWPCWLFFCSVYSTFHCHGPVLCVAFICAAFTLDIFCLVFVPLHWLFFVASTYVLFNYIWHTERGLCVSSLWLWVLLLYTEASLRLRDLKSSHANLSHLFAAHCIGYPVVYLGFDATCYFSSAFKMRVQRAVQNNPDLHVTLTSGLQLCSKGPPDTSNSRSKGKPDCGQYQCPTGSVVSSDQAHVVDCLQIRSEERTEHLLQEAFKTGSTRRVSSSSTSSSCLPKSSEALHKTTAASENSPESQSQEEQGGKGHKAAKNTSPKVRRGSRHTPSPPGGRVDKKQRAKTISPNRNSAAAQTLHTEQMNKLEQDMRRLKAELQSSRQTEQELKSHLCNLSNSERSLHPEMDLLREANMLLHTKLLCLGKTKQRDKQTSALLEKKTRAETEARLSVERQLSELQIQKQEEAAARSLSSTQEHPDTHMLRRRVRELEAQYQQLLREGHLTDTRLVELNRDLESLGQCRAVEQDTELLLSSISTLQEKAHQLELSLSAETRIKLDLFSALGDARRQLQIAHDKLFRQEREVDEMKRRMAEVMALSPAPRPAVPQYLNKLLASERYALNPRALVYHCLKK
ncbi:macoilin-1 [Periophthalmus magnuspinnatus]|uniref:macoilin-1 n=1 Tax=Periophthalmus magnuspinnatus TaxID=409849 RepID=UPI002436C11D|nr:macoilin-1 [Periophthalmus magnuspinnatus]